ncbi:MAG: HAMP domain-containing protein, partial [Deltaproteobacteria bacterium]|nr:HAMP domain-containing protein [Deltaproteobacteria bacterium]
MNSLSYKLLLSFLLVILLPIGLAILWTSKTLSTLLEKRFAEKSAAQAEQVRLLLAEKQETATGLVSWITAMQGVKRSVKGKDRDRLFQHLLPLVGSVELDFIEILDREGKIFLRVHDPSRYGDQPRLARETQGLLQGMRDLPAYGIEERDGNAYLSAAESIENEGILGVVSAGYALNPDFIKKLEKVAGARTVLTAGGWRVSVDGIGRVPENESGEEFQQNSVEYRWHRTGALPSLELRLPLKTARGQEGLISLFFPIQELTGAIRTLQKTLIAVALLGVVLALLVSWFVSRRLTNPLKELVRGTEQVASGNYSASVHTDSRDEIGALAISFNRMLEELRRSRAEVESYRQELERKFVKRGEELEETERKRAAMAYMIAHDLKNPLLGIQKALESFAQNGFEDGDQKKRLLRDLLSASDLVVGMANEMLDLYRSDFGALPLSLTAFTVEDLVQTTLRILGPELEEKKLRIVQHLHPPHISLLADKRRMTRLLINLVSNSIKFSPRGGRIYISGI